MFQVDSFVKVKKKKKKKKRNRTDIFFFHLIFPDDRMIHQIYAVIFVYGSTLLVNKVSLSLTENSRKDCPCLLDAISKTAVCQRGALLEVPSCIPNTIKRLDLSGNNIRYLTGQFQRFTDLTHLDLSYNRFFFFSFQKKARLKAYRIWRYYT